MSSKNSQPTSLDSEIGPYLGKSWPGRFGIEVELEGKVKEAFGEYWITKGDPSLRQGYEYVTSSVVTRQNLGACLAEFEKLLSDMTPRASIRTSTHIHVNVLDKTFRQVLGFIAAYYLLEELLLLHAGDVRRGNLFCLRMKDSRSILYMLKRAVDQHNVFSNFTEDQGKYSALNLCTIYKYGTVEFRFLEAIWDIEELRKWITLFDELVDRATKLGYTEVLTQYDELPVKLFIRQLLPKSSGWLIGNSSNDTLNRLLHTNYDSLQELDRHLDRVDYYSLPQHLWDDDVESGDQTPYARKVKVAPFAANWNPVVFEEASPPPDPVPMPATAIADDDDD